MKSFSEFVAKPTRNLHLTHVDESLFEGGDEAARKAIDALQSIAINDGRYKLTTKWDGAPSIFAGTDPVDGKFFVGTKSVFNKNPKLYKEASDIVANEPSGKAEKLIEALRLLPKLNIPRDTVLQGDLLWTQGDHVYETFEGQRYVTVHPNTLVYGWLAESDEGRAVRNAELGIVFHTTYRGRNNLSNYAATFGVNTDHLTTIPEVWFDNAYFKGKEIAVAPDVRQAVNETLERATRKIGNFDKIVEVMNQLPSTAAGANIKTYYNSHIREGLYPPVNGGFGSYADYVKSYWDKQFISKLKTEEGIARRQVQYQQLRADLFAVSNIFERSFHFVDDVRAVKEALICHYDNVSDQKVFYKTAEGLHESSHEGYVAINVKTGEAVKLVDRTNFSHKNFSNEIVKGWQK